MIAEMVRDAKDTKVSGELEKKEIVSNHFNFE